MFDRLTWRQRFRGTRRETRYQPHVSDDERPMARLAEIADDVEAGRIELPPRWSFERPSPGVQIWTTPAGRRYACNRLGELLPLPRGMAPFADPR
ncbi:MAG TPA: hypothetical protein VGG83_27470 [Trebonia sp.]|jgi:hypothetical protein